MKNTEKTTKTDPRLTETEEENSTNIENSEITETATPTEASEKEVEELPKIEKEDKLKLWQILIIVFSIAIFLIIVIFFVVFIMSSTSGNFNAFKLFNTEKKNTETTLTHIPNTNLQISEDPFDLEIIIDNTFFRLPLTVRELEESGWEFGSKNDADSIIAPGETAETYFALKDNNYLFATLKNFSDEETTQKDASIIGITIDKDYILSDAEVIFVKNIALGTSSKSYVESVFGKCTDIFAINKGVILTYKKNQKQAKFVFDNATGALKEVEYINDSSTENLDKTAFKQYIQEKYKHPRDLGDAPVAGILQIDDDLYKLPISVTAFIKNGWEISFKSEHDYLLGNENAYISLIKNDVVLQDVEIYNFDNTKRKIEKCYVISVDASSEIEPKILLPKNIKVGMSEDEFLKAVSGTNCTINSDKFNQYTFTNGEIILIVDVDKKENKVKYWIIRYDVK